MRTTYIKYKLNRFRAWMIREKVDFKKEFRNLEFARGLSFTLGVFSLFGAIDSGLRVMNPYGWLHGSVALFGIYLILSVYRDYKRGDDIAWEREKRRRRLYEDE